MVINNSANSTTNVQQVNVTYNIFINTAPAAIETVSKKDKVEGIKKVMPVVYEVIKWLIKIGALFTPLLSG